MIDFTANWRPYNPVEKLRFFFAGSGLIELLSLVLICMSGCSVGTQHVEDLAEPIGRPAEYEWKQINPPLDAVFFIDENLGWAVGAGNTLLKTENGGMKWQQLPTGRTPASHFRSVYFVNKSVGWMVGEDAEILKTTDGGLNWQEQDNPRPLSLYCVMFADEKSGCAVGKGGTIITTTNGGAKWEEQNPRSQLSFDRSPPNLYGVWWTIDGGWVVGADGTILKSEDGGKNWKRASKKSLIDFHSVHFKDQQTGHIIGKNSEEILVLVPIKNGKINNDILEIEDDVKSEWSLDPIGVFMDTFSIRGERAVQYVGKTKGWQVTHSGEIFATKERTAPQNPWVHQKKMLDFGIKNLKSVRFVKKTSGWIVGGKWPRLGNCFLHSDDAGATWQQGKSKSQIYVRSIHPVDTSVAWAVGDGGNVWRTTDGGKTWDNMQVSFTDSPLHSCCFSDRDTGWAVGYGGVIVATRDGGKNWEIQGQNVTRPSDHLESVFFTGDKHGWVVGTFGAVFATSDGGKTWERQPRIVNRWLKSVYFVNSETGWIVGEGGAIIHTRDGGRTWREQFSGVDFELNGIHFLDSNRGFAVGGYETNSTRTPILVTMDGGKTWVRGRHTVAAIQGLSSVWAADEDNVWAVGLDGIILLGTPIDHAAWVSWFSIAREIAGVKVEWKILDENPEKVKCNLEYSVKGVGNWSPINSQVIQRGDAFSLVWNPKEYGVREHSELLYRVSLTDSIGLTHNQILPGAYTYQSFWESRSIWEKATAITLAAGLAYLLASYVVLFVRPSVFLWLVQHFSAEEMRSTLPKTGALAIVSSLLVFAAKVSLTDYFARHRFTISDWAKRYRRGDVKFDELPSSVRKKYLSSKDCMDAWVDRRADAVRQAFSLIPAVLARPVWIPTSLQMIDRAVVSELVMPGIDDFRKSAGRERFVLAVVGDGGIGKTTLALQLARWGIENDEKTRLSSHIMLPVLLDDDIKDIVGDVASKFRQMVGDDDSDRDIIEALLRSQRILVVIDGLSERNPDTQRYIANLFDAAAVNALVITSRQPPVLGATVVTKLRPHKFDSIMLLSFLASYLRERQAEQYFPGDETVDLAKRVWGLARTTGGPPTITPLLVCLFVDNAIDQVKAKEQLSTMILSIPETILTYLRRVNPKVGSPLEALPDAIVIRAAQVLSQHAVSDDYVPAEFELGEAQSALSRAKIDLSKIAIDRLVQNGVLDQRTFGGRNLLRFRLEPIAEYLAVLEWLNSLSQLEGMSAIRYVLEHHPVRGSETLRLFHQLLEMVSSQNDHLREHPRADTTIALGKVQDSTVFAGLRDWLELQVDGRIIEVRLASGRNPWIFWVNFIKSTPGFPLAIEGFLFALEDCWQTYSVTFELPELDLK